MDSAATGTGRELGIAGSSVGHGTRSLAGDTMYGESEPVKTGGASAKWGGTGVPAAGT